MRNFIIMLLIFLLGGCSVLSTKPTELMSATGVEMSHEANGKVSRLAYHNPKKVGGDFTGHAWLKVDPVSNEVDMGVQGGASNGTQLDLKHAVNHAKVQAGAISDAMKTLSDLSKKFPGLAGGP